VIWGLRTQVLSTTGFSPFFLVYGSEAVLPTNVAFGAPRIQFYEEAEAEQTCRVNLDSLEDEDHVWFEDWWMVTSLCAE
jgi:hypothetical protein